MPVQYVLDDRQAETGAAGRARTAAVDAVKALEDQFPLGRGDAVLIGLGTGAAACYAEPGEQWPETRPQAARSPPSF